MDGDIEKGIDELVEVTFPLARTGRYCLGMRVASVTGGSILI
jgi:hypothetical protein